MLRTEKKYFQPKLLLHFNNIAILNEAVQNSLKKIFLPFIVVYRQMKKVSSHNKAMDRGLKPVIAKPGRTNNTYIFVVLGQDSPSSTIKVFSTSSF